MKVYPIFKKEEQNKIELYLQSKSKRNYLIWILGTHTGLRISDILNLKVENVQGNYINITEQKTNKIKNIKISTKLKSIIKNYINETNLNKKDVLFTSRQSNGKAMTVRRVQQIIKKIAEIVGIEENINTHSMRKTFAFNLYKLSGNSIALVMEALNHSSERITLKYLCISDYMIGDLVELL